MKIVVTGGSGFIGSHFLHKAMEEFPTAKFTNIDSLSIASDETKNGDLPTNRYIHIHSDTAIADNKLLHNTDFVFNFAAQTHVDRSLGDSAPFFHSNAISIHTFLKNCVRASVKHFVHVSTDEVYGPCEGDPFYEDARLNPMNPYSVSKVASEFLVLNTCKHEGLQSIITRGSNTYGPHQFHEKFIPNAISRLKSGDKINIYGDGLQVRDWLHVDDHVGAIIHLAKRFQNGETYNISSNDPKTNIEVAHKILSVMNRPTSELKYVEDRLGHDRRYAINNSKLLRTGWLPKHTFDKTIETVILSYC